MNCVHNVLFDEVEEVSQVLSDANRKELKDKVKVVSEMLNNNPNIRNTFYIANSTKLPVYNSINWEAEMKVFHSPHESLKEIPMIPAGRISVELWNPNSSPPEPIVTVFDIGLKDVENMIKSLDDFRKALVNLESLELVNKKAK